MEQVIEHPTGTVMPRAPSEHALPTLAAPTGNEERAATTKTKLDALTSLRFPAAALAVFGHTYTSFGTAGVGLVGTLWTSLALNQGVAFFFVLSGFILTYVYPSLDRRSGTRFVVARIARIWPMHIAALFLPLLILSHRLFADALHPQSVLMDVFLVRTWVPRPPASLNSVSWSLCVEFFFYLTFPLLIWRSRRTWAVKFGIILLVSTLLVLTIELWLYPPGTAMSFVNAFPPVRLAEFAVGMSTAMLWRKMRGRIALTFAVATLLELVTVLLVLLVVLRSSTWADQLTHTHWIGAQGTWEAIPPRSTIFGYAMSWWLRSSGFVIIPFALLIFVMALGQGAISRILAFSPLVLLGEISYSLYLIHPTLADWYVLHPIYFMRVPDNLRYPLYWIGIILISYITWSFIELPFRRWIVARYDRHFGLHRERDERRAQPAPAPLPARPRAFSFQQWRAPVIALTILLLTSTALDVVAAPPSLSSLVKIGQTPTFSVDYFGGIALNPPPAQVTRAAMPSNRISVTGWAVDNSRRQAASGVFVCVDGAQCIWAIYGYKRPDVAKLLKNDHVTFSGFTSEIPLDKLTDGAHSLTIRVVFDGKRSYSESSAFPFVVS